MQCTNLKEHEILVILGYSRCLSDFLSSNHVANNQVLKLLMGILCISDFILSRNNVVKTSQLYWSRKSMHRTTTYNHYWLNMTSERLETEMSGNSFVLVSYWCLTDAEHILGTTVPAKTNSAHLGIILMSNVI